MQEWRFDVRLYGEQECLPVERVLCGWVMTGINDVVLVEGGNKVAQQAMHSLRCVELNNAYIHR